MPMLGFLLLVEDQIGDVVGAGRSVERSSTGESRYSRGATIVAVGTMVNFFNDRRDVSS